MMIVCSNCDTGFKVPKGAITEEGRFVKCSVCDHEWVAKPGDVIDEESGEASDEKPQPTAVVVEKVEEITNKVVEEVKEVKLEEAPQQKVEEVKVDQLKAEARKEPAVAAPQAAAVATKGEHKRFVAPKLPIYDIPFFYYSAFAACFVFFFFFVGGIFVFARENLITSFPKMRDAYSLFHMHDTKDLKLQMVDCTISQIESAKSSGKEIEVEVDVVIQNFAETERKLDAIRFAIFDIERNFLGELIMSSHQVIAPNEMHRIEGRLNRVPVDSYYVAVDIGNEVDMYLRNIKGIHNLG